MNLKDKAAHDVNVKKIIINHYNSIILQEKEKIEKLNQNDALKIKNIPQQDFFKVRSKDKVFSDHKDSQGSSQKLHEHLEGENSPMQRKESIYK